MSKPNLLFLFNINIPSPFSGIVFMLSFSFIAILSGVELQTVPNSSPKWPGCLLLDERLLNCPCVNPLLNTRLISSLSCFLWLLSLLSAFLYSLITIAKYSLLLILPSILIQSIPNWIISSR